MSLLKHAISGPLIRP